jgi:hypothetical protein
MTRPRLQLHLSTLLIVALLAAGAVWVNVREQDTGDEGCLIDDSVVSTCDLQPIYCMGWPFSFETWYAVRPSNDHDEWGWPSLALNVAVCLALLAVATVAIEWATRRMKRKPTL